MLLDRNDRGRIITQGLEVSEQGGGVNGEKLEWHGKVARIALVASRLLARAGARILRLADADRLESTPEPDDKAHNGHRPP